METVWINLAYNVEDEGEEAGGCVRSVRRASPAGMY